MGKDKKVDVPAIQAESNPNVYIPAEAEILDPTTIKTVKGVRYVLLSEQAEWIKSRGAFGLETPNAMKLFGVEPSKRKNGTWRFNKNKALDAMKAVKLNLDIRMADRGSKVVFVVKK